jgi:hypothetical protein
MVEILVVWPANRHCSWQADGVAAAAGGANVLDRRNRAGRPCGGCYLIRLQLNAIR